MDDSANELLCFCGVTTPETAMILLCNCLVGALPYLHYVMQSFLMCGFRVLHPAQYDLLDNHPGTAKIKIETKNGTLVV